MSIIFCVLMGISQSNTCKDLVLSQSYGQNFQAIVGNAVGKE